MQKDIHWGWKQKLENINTLKIEEEESRKMTEKEQLRSRGEKKKRKDRYHSKRERYQED